MQIRQAHYKDAAVLASLVYDSASRLLNASFSINTQYSAQNFLVSSFRHPEGQYGYENHWVMEHNERVIGCVSAWHSEMPVEFQQFTLRSIAEYYGLEHSVNVIRTNQIVRDCIPDILQNEWCIGHLSVLKEYQCKGVASALIEFMQNLAIMNQKNCLSLDVDANNTNAIQFYVSRGFIQNSESQLTANMLTLGLNKHRHLIRPLIC